MNSCTLGKVNLLHMHTEFYLELLQQNNIRMNTMKTFVSEKIQIRENTSEKKIESKLRCSFLMEGQSLGKSTLMS